MRKKFFNLCGKSLGLLLCFEELDRLEKLRFSLFSAGMVEEWEEELKSCVMPTDECSLVKSVLGGRIVT